MIHLTSIESHIIRELEKFTYEAHARNIIGDGNWTKEIKRRLVDLGHKYEYRTCACGVVSDLCEPEWMYDLLWYKEEGDGEDAGLSEVALVMESEWNLRFDQIKYDFEKLLLANAPYRLMICQAADNKDKLKSYFPDAVKRYKAGDKGARFIIAILDNKDEFFQFMHVIGDTVREIDQDEIQQIMVFAAEGN